MQFFLLRPDQLSENIEVMAPKQVPSVQQEFFYLTYFSDFADKFSRVSPASHDFSRKESSSGEIWPDQRAACS